MRGKNGETKNTFWVLQRTHFRIQEKKIYYCLLRGNPPRPFKKYLWGEIL